MHPEIKQQLLLLIELVPKFYELGHDLTFGYNSGVQDISWVLYMNGFGSNSERHYGYDYNSVGRLLTIYSSLKKVDAYA